MRSSEIFDVTIIGGGPAGLYSAFYSGLREMKVKLIEFQPQLGGKLHVYPEKMIWDVGGQPPIQGEKLIAQLVAQGLTFDPAIVLNEKVESIRRVQNGHFELAGSSGQLHRSKTVIVAVGGGILKPQKLQIAGAERFEVTNLNYTVKSLKRYQGKTVLISGGGNSAIDWANELEPIAGKVIVTYRNAELAGHEAQVTQLVNSKVQCLLNTTITKLTASDDRAMVESVELTNQLTGETRLESVDELIINHGYEQDATLLEESELPIELADGYYIAGSVNSESTVPGLFAAGDILQHPGKLNLIAGTFQDAANAVNKAKQFVQPEANRNAMVSSHNDMFKERNKNIVKELAT